MDCKSAAFTALKWIMCVRNAVLVLGDEFGFISMVAPMAFVFFLGVVYMADMGVILLMVDL